MFSYHFTTKSAENDALREALSRVPSCTWHGHGAYPDSCWWCALNRVIPSGCEPMAKYRCTHCKAVVERDSDKAWIKSLCMKTGKDVHLIRVDRHEEKSARS